MHKVIKARSIGGEDTAAFQQRQSKKCERENFGEEDEGALTQEDIPKLQGERQETLEEVHHRAAASYLGNRAISHVFLSDFWVFQFCQLSHESIF